MDDTDDQGFKALIEYFRDARLHIFTTTTVVIVLTLAAATIVQWYVDRRRLFATFTRLGLPGPVPGFWLGNLRWSDRDYVHRHIDKWFSRYGDVFGYYRGVCPVIVIRRLETIHEVFIKRAADFPNRLRFAMNVQPFSSSVLALRGLFALAGTF